MADEPGDQPDPFAEIAAETSKSGPGAGRAKAAKGEHVAPAPAQAPELPAEWRGLGRPTKVWAYRDGAGKLLRYTLRFTKLDGEKDIRPASLWREAPDRPLKWRLSAEPAPWPLYGLDWLSARPAAPVLLVEGEKAADAAAERFPAFVAMTWPGGSNATGKADFSPLAGRAVIVWPDADLPGRRAADLASRAAIAAGAASAGVVALPALLPEGWDLADDWPAALTAAQAAILAEVALKEAQPGGVEWPLNFRMDAKYGLFFDERRDASVIPHFLSNPFEVVGLARDLDGNSWSAVVRFSDPDGRVRTQPIYKRSLASGGGEARALLANAGLVFDTARGRMEKLTSALMRVKSSCRLTLVEATGWCGERFVLPQRTIGPPGAESVLYTGEAPSLNYGEAGEIEAWRDGVAARAEGNAALTFALSAAFAAPMLRPVAGEGGGFHFRGHSSTGKSTLLIAAGSVWGGSRGEQGFGHTWRTTSNALEALALAHNDMLLCLDELAQVDPLEAGSSAYTLANGQGKGRMNPGIALRKRMEWQVLFLSSGEVSLANHMANAVRSTRPAAGQELRLVDISVEAGAGMGIWEDLKGVEGPAQLSEAVKKAARAHYGHAGILFLERLTAEREAACGHARAMANAFLEVAGRPGDSAQVRRCGLRFALVGAGGELATAWGITGWAPGTAMRAALALYRRWAEAFGRNSPREERDVLCRLRAVIQSEGSAFSPVGDKDMAEEAAPTPGGRDHESRALKTNGYRHVRGSEVRYLFHDAGWGVVFKGLNLDDAARIVERAGFLETDGEKYRLKKSFKISGQRERLYCVKSTILEADLGD